MKAITIKEAGSTAQLNYTELPLPEIKANEVLVKVHAISINPVDVKARANEGVLSWLFGEERPVILGWDISGEVVGTGRAVTDLKIGDEVFGMVNFSKPGKAYAEYVAAPADQLAKKPATITHQEAAGATLAALTALQVLKQARVSKGQKVLIHAAAGGVGHYALQIAKHLGAYVIGTSSAVNRDFVLSLGADEHIDYTSAHFEEMLTDIDFVLDTIEGETLTRSIDVLKPGGLIISIPTGNLPESDLEKARKRNVNLAGLLVQANGGDMKYIADLLEKGILKSHISQSFDFKEMDKAHHAIATGKTKGKVVVNLVFNL